MSQWISVKDRWPDEQDYVLICLRNRHVAEGYHLDGKRWRMARIPSMNIEVTHWMPLPDPPEDSNCSSDVG